jgi:sporulation protein YlmC with PRC-barrel domain
MTPARSTHRLHGAAAPGLSQARAWIGDRVVDTNGAACGRLEDVWVDAESGEPAWLLIREGRFGGGRHRLIPFGEAAEGGGHVWVPHERSRIRSAPEISGDEILTTQLRDQLREHYGVGRRRPTRGRRP